MPVIVATQEAEMRRIAVRSQPGQTILKTLSRKNPSQERAGGVAESVGQVQTPVLQKKDCKFKASLGYTTRLCVKKQTNRISTFPPKFQVLIWISIWAAFCSVSINNNLSFSSDHFSPP
jgi:hypothetical protein